MQSLNRISLAAVILAFSCITQSLSASPVTLENSVWKLLVVPGSPAQNTVEDIFVGDDLLAADLFPGGNSTWAVYTFNRNTQSYNMATTSTVLGDGEGFWIAQITGADIQIDMPAPSGNNIATVQDGCATTAGCFPVALPTDDTDTSWLITGSPFNWSVAPDDMRVKTDEPVCMGGCTLVDSDGADYTGDTVFTYDSSTGNYQSITGGDLVTPWSGFWLDVGSAADGLSPELLIPDTAAVVQVSGVVTEPDGTPAAGVAVILGDETLTTTNALGNFAISLVSNARHVLQFLSGEYASQVKVIDLPLTGGQVNIDVTMLQKGIVTNVDSAAAFIVVGPSGASVTSEAAAGIPAFMNEDGELVGGQIELSITVVDVEDPALLPGFPGAFIGTPQDSAAELLLVSQGTVEFSFRDLEGNPLQLADETVSAFFGGQTAVIQIPLFSDELPDGSKIEEGQDIPFWSLNEVTGIWEQEGVGIVVANLLSPTGLALEATVTHFSWWNSDISPETGTIQVGVSGPAAGTVRVHGGATANLGNRLNAIEVTTVGTLTKPLAVPAGPEVCIYADVVLDDIEASFSTSTRCVNLDEDENRVILFEFDLLADALAIEIKNQSGRSEGQSYEIASNIGSPIEPITIKPLTPETDVEYSYTNLPAGLELISEADENSVLVKGRPTESGVVSSVVTGTDSEGNSASVSLLYTISAELLEPELASLDSLDTIFLTASNGVDSTQFDLNQYNRGGLASDWFVEDILLIFDSNAPGRPPVSLSELPDGVELNENTGLLTVMSPFGIGSPLAPPGFEGSATLSAMLRAENRDPLDASVVRSDKIEVFISRSSYFDGPGGGDGPAQ